MKSTVRLILVILTAFFLSLQGCMHNTQADLQSLISPASLPYLKNAKMIQVSSYDTSGGNDDRIMIRAGHTATILDVEGPGMISRIWMTIDSRDPYFLRRIILRMYWDGEAHPSVEVPVGDFFGNGFTYTHFVSHYLGMTSGGYVCYFPMPFERLARIEVCNETGLDILAFYFQINYYKFASTLGSQVAYFHAFWNRDIRTDYDSNYQALYTEGQGHIAGMNMNVQSYDGSLGFLEGDEMIYVDGERKPSIYGTGTEDYFSSGWYFSTGEYSAPYHGLIHKNDSLGRISAFRLHIPDQIPFRKSVKFTLEHGHRNESVVDMATTVFWYQIEPHLPYPPLPVAGQRIPLRVVKPADLIEAETMKFSFRGLRSEIEDLSAHGPDWSQNRQMLIHGFQGSSFTTSFDGLDEPLYNMSIYYTKGPDYGNTRVYVNGRNAGKLDGYARELLPEGRLDIHQIKASGKIFIEFRNDGKDDASAGFRTGLDGFSLEPVRQYIPCWYILGPFPNRRLSEPQRLGIDSIYPPEQGIDLKREFPGAGEKQISWQYVKTPQNGYMSLRKLFTPNELVVAYALTYIWSPDTRTVPLFIGTDDGAKVFFNNRLIYRYLGVRVAEPDQIKLELMMKPGWNKLLLKIENNLGGYGFYARIPDYKGSLVISADQIFAE